MNYEKIIVELLARIQTLEEKVDTLMNDKYTGSVFVTHEATVNNVVKVKTKYIRDFIEARKIEVKNRGEEFIVLRASDQHRINRLKIAMPMFISMIQQRQTLTITFCCIFTERFIADRTQSSAISLIISVNSMWK